MKIQKYQFEPLDSIANPDSSSNNKNLQKEHDISSELSNEQQLTYSQEKVEQIKKEAFEEGYQKAKSEIDQENNKINKDLITIYEKIAHDLGSYNNFLKEENEKNIEIISELTITIMNKLSGLFLQKFSAEIVQETIKSSLTSLHNNSSLNIVVNSEIKDVIENQLNKIVQEANFEGTIKILTNENIPKYDCQINWDTGNIKSDKQQLLNNIENILLKQYSNLR